MKVAVILTARPSWAKLEPVCAALRRRPDVGLQLICCASSLLERYGNVSAIVEREYPITERIYSVVEGATLETSAIETAVLQAALARSFARLKPDLVLVCADRHEVLAAASAARMLEIPLGHMQGGEKSGSVDNDIRDSITQLADYHFVCTKLAAMRVYALTGDMDNVIVTGCPSIDLTAQALSDPPVTFAEVGGVYEDNGHTLKDFSRPFQLVLFHPVTDTSDRAGAEMRTVLGAVTRTDLPRLVFWPGQDAGAEAMSKVVREWTTQYSRARSGVGGWHLIRNLPPRRFLRLLSQATVLVGNSSAGIREASYLGVPVVNIGPRQQGRECGAHVWHTRLNHREIINGIQQQAAHGPYPKSTLYGKGDSGERIASVICERVGADTSSKRLQGRAG